MGREFVFKGGVCLFRSSYCLTLRVFYCDGIVKSKDDDVISKCSILPFRRELGGDKRFSCNIFSSW